jgi:hypothetical protein
VYDPESPPDQAHICNFPNLHVKSTNLKNYKRFQSFDLGTTYNQNKDSKKCVFLKLLPTLHIETETSVFCKCAIFSHPCHGASSNRFFFTHPLYPSAAATSCPQGHQTLIINYISKGYWQYLKGIIRLACPLLYEDVKP